MKIISWFKLYWMTFKYTHTPLIFFNDFKYKTISIVFFQTLIAEYQKTKMKYSAEYFDCDDFSRTFQSDVLRRMFNSVGIVVGWHKSLHSYNIILTDEGLKYFEPQTLSFVKKGYYGFIVIF